MRLTLLLWFLPIHTTTYSKSLDLLAIEPASSQFLPIKKFKTEFLTSSIKQFSLLTVFKNNRGSLC
jgi:hypothetical protein